jgi:hypothetical protein
MEDRFEGRACPRCRQAPGEFFSLADGRPGPCEWCAVRREARVASAEVGRAWLRVARVAVRRARLAWARRRARLRWASGWARLRSPGWARLRRSPRWGARLRRSPGWRARAREAQPAREGGRPQRAGVYRLRHSTRLRFPGSWRRARWGAREAEPVRQPFGGRRPAGWSLREVGSQRWIRAWPLTRRARWGAREAEPVRGARPQWRGPQRGPRPDLVIWDEGPFEVEPVRWPWSWRLIQSARQAWTRAGDAGRRAWQRTRIEGTRLPRPHLREGRSRPPVRRTPDRSRWDPPDLSRWKRVAGIAPEWERILADVRPPDWTRTLRPVPPTGPSPFFALLADHADVGPPSIRDWLARSGESGGAQPSPELAAGDPPSEPGEPVRRGPGVVEPPEAGHGA